MKAKVQEKPPKTTSISNILISNNPENQETYNTDLSIMTLSYVMI